MKAAKNIRMLNSPGYYSSTEYPQFVELANRQLDSHWRFTDPGVPNDLHSILVDLSEADRHAIVSVLLLFVHYELRLGTNFWSAVGHAFPRAESYRMGSVFASMEIAVHSPFYAEVNRLLNLDNKEFYLEYKENPILVSRMDFLEKNCKLGKSSTTMEKLITLAVLAFTEGGVLYSSFTLLKSFQANGSNSIPSVVTGVDYVVIDEQLHTEGAAALFQQLVKEAELTPEELLDLHTQIIAIAEQVKQHEFEITSIIFEKGKISTGVTDKQMENFVESRLDLILQYMSIEAQYKPKYNPVATWFYKNIGAPKLVDFFNRTATSYSRDWNENKLSWNAK